MLNFFPNPLEFNTFYFVFFAAVAIAAYRLLPNKWMPLSHLLFGAAFVLSHTDACRTLFLLGLCGLIYLLSHLYRKSGKTGFIYAGFILIAGVFLSFKLNTQILRQFPFFSLVGVSYLCLKLYHFLSDVKNGAVSESRLSRFMGYLLFFPSYLSGPITRYQYFSECYSAKSKMQSSDGLIAILRILTGVFKKFVLSAWLYPVSICSLDLHKAGPEAILLSLAAYSLYLYLDFSGYTDMARGMGKFLGAELPPNFQHPYLRRNIIEFWTHWHISLSQWLRDYVYMPISLAWNRNNLPFKKHSYIFANLATMLLCGIWHGVSWNFALWGLYHGAGLSIARWNKWNFPVVISCFINFWFVTFGWAFFALPVDDAILALSKISRLIAEPSLTKMQSLLPIMALIILLCAASRPLLRILESFKNYLFSLSNGGWRRKFSSLSACFIFMPVLFYLASVNAIIPFLLPETHIKHPNFFIPFATVKYRVSGVKTDRMDYTSTNRKILNESFSNHDITKPKEPGEYRIAVFGNSIGYGGFVDFDKIASSLLGRRFESEGSSVRIYNLCVHGATPLETLLLMNEAAKQKTDCFIWLASYRECAASFISGTKIERHSDIPYLALNKLIPLESANQSVSSEERFYRQLRSRFPLLAHADSFRALNHFVTISFFGYHPEWIKPSNATAGKTVYIPYEDTLTRIARLCGGKEISLFVFYMPSPADIMKKEIPIDFAAWNGENRPFSLLNRILGGKGFKNNFDMTETFPLSELHDGYHMSEKGNEFLADFIYSKIKDAVKR